MFLPADRIFSVDIDRPPVVYPRYAGKLRTFRMASLDDEIRDPMFQIGRLNARVEGLEARQNRHDTLLDAMDGKLDAIKLQLERAFGGNERVGAIVKWTALIVSAIAAATTLIISSVHFWGH